MILERSCERSEGRPKGHCRIRQTQGSPPGDLAKYFNLVSLQVVVRKVLGESSVVFRLQFGLRVVLEGSEVSNYHNMIFEGS
jgi:hypothetical protein